MDDYTAVAVGYNFGVVPAASLNGIRLKEAGVVRYDSKNRTLYKGLTYEDSRKIDTLLDRFGEYPTKDHLIKPVIMHGEVEMEIPGFDRERDNFFFGGYAFVCDDKLIPFDFSGVAWNINQEGDRVLVSFETGRTSLLTDYYLDDCYEESYQQVGLRINDITAEYLSRATAISEFMVCLELEGKELCPEDISRNGSFHIKSLSFSDNEKEHPVANDVLSAFHQKLCEKSNSIDSRILAAEARAKTGSEFNIPKAHQNVDLSQYNTLLKPLTFDTSLEGGPIYAKLGHKPHVHLCG